MSLSRVDLRPSEPDFDGLSENTMRAAIAARDPAYDNRFVYGVITTAVYCRPSCKSRPARPENLRFFANEADARATGLRACKRCRPDERARQRGAPGRTDGGPGMTPPTYCADRTFSTSATVLTETGPTRDAARIAEAIDTDGYALLPNVLSGSACTALADGFDDAERFRSTVEMARHGFGRGRYRYFARPLPSAVAALRRSL